MTSLVVKSMMASFSLSNQPLTPIECSVALMLSLESTAQFSGSSNAVANLAKSDAEAAQYVPDRFDTEVERLLCGTHLARLLQDARQVDGFIVARISVKETRANKLISLIWNDDSIYNMDNSI